jgi:hypothetical protein
MAIRRYNLNFEQLDRCASLFVQAAMDLEQARSLLNVPEGANEKSVMRAYKNKQRIQQLKNYFDTHQYLTNPALEEARDVLLSPPAHDFPINAPFETENPETENPKTLKNPSNENDVYKDAPFTVLTENQFNTKRVELSTPKDVINYIDEMLNTTAYYLKVFNKYDEPLFLVGLHKKIWIVLPNNARKRGLVDIYWEKFKISPHNLMYFKPNPQPFIEKARWEKKAREVIKLLKASSWPKDEEWWQKLDSEMQGLFDDTEYQQHLNESKEKREDRESRKTHKEEERLKEEEQDVLAGKLKGHWLTAQYGSTCMLCGDPIQPGMKMFWVQDEGGLHPPCCGYLKNKRKKDLLKKRLGE